MGDAPSAHLECGDKEHARRNFPIGSEGSDRLLSDSRRADDYD